MTNSIKKFEIGTEYFGRSVCDHGSIFTAKIIKRTEKNVWFIQRGETVRRSIKTYDGCELILPLGNFSMAPCICADNPTSLLEG